MKVSYAPDVPETLLPIIKERVESTTYAFPSWCQDLKVFYETENPNQYVAAIASEYSYRFVQLTIFPDFFNDSNWEETLLHEIQHSMLAPYKAVVLRILDTFIPDDMLREYLKNQLTDAEEAVVQDAAFSLKNIIDKYSKS